MIVGASGVDQGGIEASSRSACQWGGLAEFWSL